eukprot:gnl/MRDRNA2_/MRDRNA2_35759_c0_seq1.p1 gnl/MRDRNA2_/MRDRNA2_35759_c0~~gnl/MRDRNA2_/MRDRNA2_35759_c0_seq1.p1  ORF type:complete len:887 (-),score=145.17 gnl/MRDRNA2_/MRDRNA2_35759_c0_seq1:11-2671(-)
MTMDLEAAGGLGVDLEEELHRNFAAEELQGDNRYRCERCKSLQDARCKAFLRSSPPFLHIVLDRFRWDMSTGQRQKLLHEVRYPEMLDLTKLLEDTGCSSERPRSSTYELIGILEHHSQTADSGHYTATLRQPFEGTNGGGWWQLNDNLVSPVESPGNAVQGGDGKTRWSSTSAYMLAYRRVDKDARYLEINGYKVPSAVAAQVDRLNQQLEVEIKESGERLNHRMALVMEREELVGQLRSLLEENSGVDSLSLSIVPRKWLESWLEYNESEDLGYGKTKLDYSALLMPQEGEGEVRLDPFAMWDGRAKALPTQVLMQHLLNEESRAEKGGIQLLPNGLKIKQMVVSELVCAKVCQKLSELFFSNRCLLQLLEKIRFTEEHQRQPDSVKDPIQVDDSSDVDMVDAGNDLVCIFKTEVTRLNKLFGGQPLEKRKRGRKPVSNAAALWSEVQSERARNVFRSASSTSDTSTIGEQVRCRHGNISPGKQLLPATQADVNQLVRLCSERSRLWKEFGITAEPLVHQEELHPWPCHLLPGQIPPVCEECKQNKKRIAEELNESTHMRKRFKHLQEQNLPVDRNGHRRSVVGHLLDGEYALVSQEWRLKWLRHLDKCGPKPPPINPKALICEHGKIRYDAARYFHDNSTGFKTVDAIRHPHSSAYTLIPIEEAKDLIKEYNSSEPLLVEDENQIADNCQTTSNSQSCNPDWCILKCTLINFDNEAVRFYETHPGPCDICSKVEPPATCQLQVRDARGAEAIGSQMIDSQVQLSWKGTDLKNHVVQHTDIISLFGAVTSGQLLLFLEVGARSEPVGDADCLSEMLSRQQLVSPPEVLTLTVEIHAFDLGEPAEKIARPQGGSSLQNSIFVSEACRKQAHQASQAEATPTVGTE